MKHQVGKDQAIWYNLMKQLKGKNVSIKNSLCDNRNQKLFCSWLKAYK